MILAAAWTNFGNIVPNEWYTPVTDGQTPCDSTHMSNPLKPKVIQLRKTDGMVAARVRVGKAWLVTRSTVKKQRTDRKWSGATRPQSEPSGDSLALARLCLLKVLERPQTGLPCGNSVQIPQPWGISYSKHNRSYCLKFQYKKMKICLLVVCLSSGEWH